MYIFWPYLMKLKKLGRTIVSAPIPIWVIQCSVFIGFALMLWHSLVKLLQPYEGDNAAPSK